MRHGVLVDDVEFRTVRRYYDPVLSARLLADGPVPDAARTTLDRLYPEVLHQVSVILDGHALLVREVSGVGCGWSLLVSVRALPVSEVAGCSAFLNFRRDGRRGPWRMRGQGRGCR